MLRFNVPVISHVTAAIFPVTCACNLHLTACTQSEKYFYSWRCMKIFSKFASASCQEEFRCCELCVLRLRGCELWKARNVAKKRENAQNFAGCWKSVRRYTKLINNARISPKYDLKIFCAFLGLLHLFDIHPPYFWKGNSTIANLDARWIRQYEAYSCRNPNKEKNYYTDELLWKLLKLSVTFI